MNVNDLLVALAELAANDMGYLPVKLAVGGDGAIHTTWIDHIETDGETATLTGESR